MTARVKALYPRACAELGGRECVLEIDVYEACKTFAKLGEYFQEWMSGQTMMLFKKKGYIYAWDVEDYLEGRDPSD